MTIGGPKLIGELLEHTGLEADSCRPLVYSYLVGRSRFGSCTTQPRVFQGFFQWGFHIGLVVLSLRA